MRTSIRDVAEQAGVSAVTVSNVLRGRPGRASAATRARVLKAAKKLRYAPVSQPVTQKRHVETRVIGLVFDGTPLEGLWGMPTFWGMREAAVEHDYDLLTMLRVRPDWMMDQEELQFLDRRSDGFIFIAPGNRYQTLEVLVKHKLPVVACFTNDVPEEVPAIMLDNAGAMHQAVDHLIARGHQRILFLTASMDRSDFKTRQSGFEEAMNQAGLLPKVLLVRDLQEPGCEEKLVTTLARQQITAVVCATDTLAYAVWDVMENKGRSVPQDLSIIGMDDLAESAQRGLTSIRYSCEEVGRRTIEAIVSLMQGGVAKSMNSVVPVELVERASVASLP
jgi:DNA-binding LacI/PurR family transcriptional regulator